MSPMNRFEIVSIKIKNKSVVAVAEIARAPHLDTFYIFIGFYYYCFNLFLIRFFYIHFGKP